MSWMQRLRYAFGVDLRRCPQCGAAWHVLAVIADPKLQLGEPLQVGGTRPYLSGRRTRA